MAPMPPSSSSTTSVRPRARYPIAIEQAYAATKYVAEHAKEFKVDASRLAVAGDSVGGNMTAAVTLACQGTRRPGHRSAGAVLPGHRRQFRDRFLQRVRQRSLADQGSDEVVLERLSARRSQAQGADGFAAAGIAGTAERPAAGAHHRRRERRAARRRRSLCPQAQPGRRQGHLGALQRHDPRLRASERHQPKRLPSAARSSLPTTRCAARCTNSRLRFRRREARRFRRAFCFSEATWRRIARPFSISA